MRNCSWGEELLIKVDFVLLFFCRKWDVHDVFNYVKWMGVGGLRQSFGKCLIASDRSGWDLSLKHSSIASDRSGWDLSLKHSSIASDRSGRSVWFELILFLSFRWKWDVHNVFNCVKWKIVSGGKTVFWTFFC